MDAGGPVWRIQRETRSQTSNLRSPCYRKLSDFVRNFDSESGFVSSEGPKKNTFTKPTIHLLDRFLVAFAVLANCKKVSMICPAKLKKQTLPSAHQEKHGLGKNECTINSNVRVHSDFSPNLERYGRISNSQQERHSFSHDATFSIFSISTGTGIVTQWDWRRTVTGAQKL